MTNVLLDPTVRRGRTGTVLTGTVVPGDRRGRLLGFPTANVDLDDVSLSPPDGVYVARVQIPGYAGPVSLDRRAALSVGTNPTFGGHELRVEAHLLDFDGDLYGRPITVRILDYLRAQVRYDSLEPLIAQIRSDVERVRLWQW